MQFSKKTLDTIHLVNHTVFSSKNSKELVTAAFAMQIKPWTKGVKLLLYLYNILDSHKNNCL